MMVAFLFLHCTMKQKRTPTMSNLMILVALLLCSSFGKGSPFIRTRKVGSSQAQQPVGRDLQNEEDEFIEFCTEELTGNNVLEDDIISQMEYAAFIVDFCEMDGATCEDAPDSTDFTSFGLQLQLAFVSVACEQISNKTQCVEGFINMLEDGDEFGYDIDGQSLEDVKNKLVKLCSSIFSLVVDTMTAAPTVAPSASPSSAAPVPSASPVTSSPTVPSGEETSPPSTPTEDPTASPTGGPVVAGSEGDSSDSLSSGAIAGIAIAAAVLVLAAAFLVSRRRKSGKHLNRGLFPPPQEVKSDNSIYTEDSAQIFTAENVAQVAADDTFDLAGSSDDSGAEEKFAGSNAAAIALDRHDDDSSRGLSPKDARQKKVDDLDRAIDLGDWDAVYKISGTLSGDDASSNRSFSSSSSKGRSLKHPKDKARASQLQSLVERGDWDAVAAAAAAFSSGESSAGGSSIFNGSEASSDALLGAAPKDPSSPRFDEAAAKFAEARATEDAIATNRPTDSPPRRSFLDFVSGVGNSPAAAAAISNGNEEDGLVGASPRDGVPAAITSGDEIVAGAAAAALAAEETNSKRSSKRSWKKLFRKRSSQEDYIVDNMENESQSREGGPNEISGEPSFITPNSSDVGEVSDMTTTSPDELTNVSPDELTNVSHDVLTAEAVGQPPYRASPVSSGMSTPIDAEMAEEFERMVAANDWKGLAALAGQEIGRDESTDDGAFNPADVNLRPTPEKESKPRAGVRRFPSLHGAKVLIPFWEKLIHEVEAERKEKAGLGDLDEEAHEKDMPNEELLQGAGSAPSVTPVTPPLSPTSGEAREGEVASSTQNVPSIPLDDGEHTRKTYDAAAAFAKAWNNLKHEAESGEEGANDVTIAATEWAIKHGAKADMLASSSTDAQKSE